MVWELEYAGMRRSGARRQASTEKADCYNRGVAHVLRGAGLVVCVLLVVSFLDIRIISTVYVLTDPLVESVLAKLVMPP